MKITKLLSLFLLTAVISFAADKIVAGPKGGRLLETSGQKTEFFVNADRKVEINFYDANLQPIEPGSHVVAVTAEAKSGRTPLELEKTSTGFISKTKLPDGEPYRVVVQVRAKADARPQNFRVELDLEKCGECEHPEYACTCGH